MNTAKQKNRPVIRDKHKEKSIPEKKDVAFNLPEWVGLLGVVVLGLVIYSNSHTAEFQFDDFYNIVNNPAIRELSDVNAWWNYVPTRRIAFFTFALNYHFHEFDVRYWHYVNLGIHLVTSVLVWWLARLILASPALEDNPLARHKKTIALLVALMFVSHPLATQSVTYIVQRLSALVALFYLLSLALYLKARLAGTGKISGYLLFAGSLGAAVLAMITKENAFTLPLAIVLCEICFFQKNTFSINIRNPRTIAAAVAFAAVTIAVLSTVSLNIFSPIPPSLDNKVTVTSLNYLLTNFSIIVKYIQLLFLPLNQNLDYDFPVSNSLFDGRTFLSFLFLLSLLVLAVYQFKKNRIIAFGIFWFLLTLSVESSIIPIKDYIFEHRTYLPSFGFFLILCAGIYHLYLNNKYRVPAIILFTAIIASNAYLTYARNNVWSNSLTLWNDVIAKSPGKARPLNNRGQTYLYLKQWDAAIKDFNKAITIYPRFADAYYNRGIAYNGLSQWDKAIADYNKALELNPKYAKAFVNRGLAYNNTKQWDKAIEDFNKAIDLNPNSAIPYLNRGIAQANLGQLEAAIKDFSKAIDLNPNYVKAFFNRGGAYSNNGQLDKAIEDYTTAIKLDPKLAEAYYSRGFTYGRMNRHEPAIADFSTAIDLDPKYAMAYFNRGVAYSSQGQFEQAIEDYDRAIVLKPNMTIAIRSRDQAANILRNRK